MSGGRNVIPRNESASAFVPGHVTTFFSVHRREDPARTGSRGGGITLSEGTTVEVKLREETRILLDGTETSVRPVERVLDAMDVTARVTITADLPVGAGFGVSGGATLGTAIAANRAAGCGYTENELVRTAHVAEVEAGTGLGDVVAQARGGLPIRLEPGAPEHGRLDGIPASPRVEYVSFGSVSTEDVLSGDTSTLTAAGERALADLRAEPTTDRLVELSRRFAREADLLTDRVADAVAAVRAEGGDAAMAMLGDTAFAFGDGLSSAGYDPEVCAVHPTGATLRPPRLDRFER